MIDPPPEPRPLRPHEVYITRFPSRCQPMRFDNFDPSTLSEPWKAKWNWLRDELPQLDDGVFCYGPAGSGKTHFAIALMHAAGESLEAIKSEYPKQYRFEYTTSVEFFFDIKQCYRDYSGESEQEIIQKYSSCSVLLIDDLGAEKVSDWSRQLFYLILDRRYQNEMTTYLTSNLSLKELSEAIDDRLASRIAGMCHVIEFKGKDRRIEKLKIQASTD